MKYEYQKYPLNDKEYIAVDSIKTMKKIYKIRLKIIKDIGALVSKKCRENITNQVLREEFKDKVEEW